MVQDQDAGDATWKQCGWRETYFSMKEFHSLTESFAVRGALKLTHLFVDSLNVRLTNWTDLFTYMRTKHFYALGSYRHNRKHSVYKISTEAYFNTKNKFVHLFFIKVKCVQENEIR